MKNGNFPLIEATAKEYVSEVKLLLESGADPNSTDKFGGTPLMFAAAKNNLEIIEILLGKGAKINIKNPYGVDAVFSAVLNKSVGALELLLSRGASPNIHSSNGAYPLLCAVDLNSLEMVNILLANGVNIDMKNNYGTTALILASSKGYIDIVKVLLENGADPTIKEVNGTDALSIATAKNFITIATLIKSALMSPEKRPGVSRQPGSVTRLPHQYNLYTGTGWLTTGGYVITNYHVVDGQVETQVRFNSISQDLYKADVVLSDKYNDLAVLKLKEVPKKNLRGIPISSSLPKIGEEVFTIGYPKTSIMGKNPKVTNGIISSLSGLGDDPRIIQTTVAIQSGNSGGPLLNMHGEAVGVTTSTLRALVSKKGLDIPQSVNYAVKSAYVFALLSSLSEKNKYPAVSVTSSKLVKMVPKLQDSIVQVIVKSNK